MEEPEKLKINSVKPEKLQMLESMMKPETLQVFEKRLEEEYDLETDELYCIWSGLKKLAISGSECIQQEEPKRKTELFQEKLKDPGPSVSPEMQLSLSSVQKKSIPSGLDEILQYPKPDPAKKTKGKSTLDMPKHLTSEQMYQYLELKRTQKEEAELQKVQRREERAQKKKKREEEQERKKLERERKKREQEIKKLPV